ncbi:MAG: hypothetical protein ABI950_03105 [Solirubrobacteraceae bacterium]
MIDPRSDDELLVEAIGTRGVRRLRTRGDQLVLVRSGAVADALIAVLDHESQGIDGEITEGVGGWLRAIVGGGVLRLNPAVVRAVLRPAPGGETRVELSASAKEGLIPQRTAKKALARVVAALDQEAGAPPMR